MRMVLPLLVVAVMAGQAFAQQAPPRDSVRRPAPPTGTGTIAGYVLVDESEPKPLRRARVTASAVALPGGRTVITQDDGSYQIEGLPPGRYTVRAVKDGYVAMAFGARRPTARGTSIALEGREARRGTNIQLPRGAVLSGMITDGEAQPLAGLAVTALVKRFDPESGEHRLAPTGIGAITDDRGEYRLFGLAAGEYAIAATARDTPDSSLQVLSDAEIRRALSEVRQTNSPFRSRPGFEPALPSLTAAAEPRRSVISVPTYFPGTTRGARAAIVRLGRAEERTGLDFAVEHVPTGSITATVLMPDLGDQPVEVRLVQSDGGMPSQDTRMARTRPGAGVGFGGLAPGQYTLIALPYTGGMPTNSGTAHWSRMDVVVDGEALTGLFLIGERGLTVEGLVKFEGATPPPSLASFRPLLPVAHLGAGRRAAPRVVLQPDGRFTMDVVPGPYRLLPTAPGIRQPLGRWFLKSVVVNGRDILDAPIDLRQGTSDAVVTFTDRASEISGRVVAANGDAEGDCYIVLFSTNRNAWFAGSRRVAGVRARDDGTFTIRNLPAGEYWAVAVQDLEDGEWGDSELLDRLSAGAVKLTLADAEKKLQELRVR